MTTTLSVPGTRSRHQSQTYEVTIAGVLTKRADMFGEMLRLRDKLVAVEEDLAALDRVLGVLGYAGDLEAVPPRVVRDAPFRRGQVMRLILDHMRKADGPLTARQIAQDAFGHLTQDRDDPVPLDSLSRRVLKSLGRLRRDGAVNGIPDADGAIRWRLADV